MDIQAIFDKYLGKPVEAEDPSNLDQCLDWAFKYCDELNIPRDTIRHLYAYEIWTKPNDLTLQYFDYIPNTPNGMPVLGDIIIFGTGVGVAGHVSTCQKADVNSVTSADQNWNGHKYVEYITHPYDNILGWLSPKQLHQPPASTPADPTAQPMKQITIDAYRAVCGVEPSADEIDNRLNSGINTYDLIKDLLNNDSRSLVQKLKTQLDSLTAVNNQQVGIITDLRKQLTACQQNQPTIPPPVSTGDLTALTVLINHVELIVGSKWTWFGPTSWKNRLSQLKQLIPPQ